MVNKMKRIIIALILAALTLITAIPVSAAPVVGTGELIISLSSGSVEAGGTFTADIYLRSQLPITGFQFCITCDERLSVIDRITGPPGGESLPHGAKEVNLSSVVTDYCHDGGVTGIKLTANETMIAAVARVEYIKSGIGTAGSALHIMSITYTSTMAFDSILNLLNMSSSSFAVTSGGGMLTLSKTTIVSGSTEFILRQNSPIFDENGIFCCVPPNTTTEGFADQLANINPILSAVDANGSPLGANDLLGTGSTIRLLDSDSSTLDERVVIVAGDLDGDGIVTLLEIATVRLYISGSTGVLTGNALLAADVNHDSIINTRDVLIMRRIAANLG